MGNCSERPEVMAVRNTSSEWYKNVADYTSEKYNATKEYIGPKML